MKKKIRKEKPTTALAIMEKPKELSIWSRADEVRKLFAPTLTELEFEMFLGLGRALNANPFTREIWAVKYDASKAASIFCGRDFYRRKAQEQSNYDGHTVEVIYEEDDFKMVDGEPHHSFNLKTRKKILGAYCIVRRKGIKQPFVSMVSFAEYNKGFSNWKSMPETMIKKVAEAQGLRGAFQGIFAGTYDESEQWEQPKSFGTQVPNPENPPQPPKVSTSEDMTAIAIAAIAKAETGGAAVNIHKRAVDSGKFETAHLKKIHEAASARANELDSK